MRRASAALLAAAASALAASCGRTTVLHCYRHTPAGGWEQSDALTYKVDTVRQGGVYKFDVGVRITSAFPYKQLWLVAERRFTNPPESEADTLACSFVDGGGNRNGSGTRAFQYVFRLGEITLAERQTGTVTVRHIMRREILPGITDIGVNIHR